MAAALMLVACNNQPSESNSESKAPEYDRTSLSIIAPTGAPALVFYNYAKLEKFETNSNPAEGILPLMVAGKKDVVVLPTNAGMQAIINKKAENISVTNCQQKNIVVDEMVKFFSSNPEFTRVLCQVSTPFTTYEELGCMMCDAMKAETGADIAFINRGGVRFDTHPTGPFTVSEVLQLDPFGNDVVEVNLTGEELRQMLLSCSNNDKYGPPCVSGCNLEYTTDKNDSTLVKNVKLLTTEGKKFDLKRTYKVATQSYTMAICTSPHKDPGRSINIQTSNMIMKYLEKCGAIDYAGACRVTPSK